MEQYDQQKAPIRQEHSRSVSQPAASESREKHICAHCGAFLQASDNFCEECGHAQKSNSCKHCHAGIHADWEICPQCGHSLQATECSFCGSPIHEQDTFCSECGNPSTGIPCPQCDTLNFRNFCRKCNHPLNEMAEEALKGAKADLRFQKALALAEELAALEDFLFSQADHTGLPPATPELSAENKQLLDQYKELLDTFQKQTPQEKNEKGINSTHTEKPASEPVPEPTYKAAPPIKLSFSLSSKEDTMVAYKEKLGEMQQILQSMIPDADMTPSMQRDYYSARKVEVITTKKVRVRTSWLCNAYGCHHDQPNECSEPFKGGRWIYEEREETTTTWQHQ